MNISTIKGDSVTVNPKPTNFLMFWLASRFPGFFKQRQHVHIVLRDQRGYVKEERHIYNTVTTAGKNGTADQILASPTLAKPTHMAVGTGSPGANALGAETDRNALTSKTRSTNVVTFVGDWAAGDATAALTEAAVEDAASSGNAWLTSAFAVINKGALDTLQISWSYTVA